MKPNAVAKDVRTPLYRPRVVSVKKMYNRKKDRQQLRREMQSQDY